MTPYLRAWVEVSDGVLRWEVPRTLLGVVPLGLRHVNIPLASVRWVRVIRATRPLGRLAVAALLGVGLLWAIGWIALPVVLVGIWLVMVSFRPYLEVETVQGIRESAAFCLDAQLDPELYATSVNELAEEARRLPVS